MQSNCSFPQKIFTVDGHHNRRNDRWVAKSPSDVPPMWRTKNPAKAMALGIVGSDGQVVKSDNSILNAGLNPSENFVKF